MGGNKAGGGVGYKRVRGHLIKKVIFEQTREAGPWISHGELRRNSLPYKGTSKYEGFVWTLE